MLKKKGLLAPALPIPSREKFANRSIVFVASMPSVSSSSLSGDSKNESPVPQRGAHIEWVSVYPS